MTTGKLDILTFGEALVEVMRTGVDQPLNAPAPFEGPFPSGAPFIFAVQAARLGAKTACIGCVGADAFGDCLIAQLQADGVATETVQVLKTHTTGVAFIAYRGDGSRDFVFHLRDAAAGQLRADHADPALFAGLRVLHVMGSSLAMHADALALGTRALQLAQAAGARISLDLNIRPQLLTIPDARRLYASFIAASDVLFATSEEARLIIGTDSTATAIDALRADKPERLIVLHEGEDGCIVIDPTGQHSVAAFPVTEIDATGAGDCFDAGFLVRWLETGDAQAAAQFANACGALAVTARGPMSGAQTRAVVEAFMADNNR